MGCCNASASKSDERHTHTSERPTPSDHLEHPPIAHTTPTPTLASPHTTTLQTKPTETHTARTFKLLGPTLLKSDAIDEDDTALAERLERHLKPVDFLAVMTTAERFKRRLNAAKAIQRRVRERRSTGADAPRPLPTPSRSREDAIVAGMHLLEQRLSALDQTPEVIQGDGACQFRSMSYQLFGTQEHHGHVRATAIDHMRGAARDVFSVYFDGERSFSAYLDDMSAPTTWGEELTLRAAADALQVTIHVLTSEQENWHIKYEVTSPRRILFLTYVSPVHYNSVCRGVFGRSG